MTNIPFSQLSDGEVDQVLEIYDTLTMLKSEFDAFKDGSIDFHELQCILVNVIIAHMETEWKLT